MSTTRSPPNKHDDMDLITSSVGTVVTTTTSISSSSSSSSSSTPPTPTPTLPTARPPAPAARRRPARRRQPPPSGGGLSFNLLDLLLDHENPYAYEILLYLGARGTVSLSKVSRRFHMMCISSVAEPSPTEAEGGSTEEDDATITTTTTAKRDVVELSNAAKLWKQFVLQDYGIVSVFDDDENSIYSQQLKQNKRVELSLQQKNHIYPGTEVEISCPCDWNDVYAFLMIPIGDDGTNRYDNNWFPFFANACNNNKANNNGDGDDDDNNNDNLVVIKGDRSGKSFYFNAMHSRYGGYGT